MAAARRNDDEDIGLNLAKCKYAYVPLMYIFWVDTSKDGASYDSKKAADRSVQGQKRKSLFEVN